MKDYMNPDTGENKEVNSKLSNIFVPLKAGSPLHYDFFS